MSFVGIQLKFSARLLSSPVEMVRYNREIIFDVRSILWPSPCCPRDKIDQETIASAFGDPFRTTMSLEVAETAIAEPNRILCIFMVLYKTAMLIISYCSRMIFGRCLTSVYNIRIIRNDRIAVKSDVRSWNFVLTSNFLEFYHRK